MGLAKTQEISQDMHFLNRLKPGENLIAREKPEGELREGGGGVDIAIISYAAINCSAGFHFTHFYTSPPTTFYPSQPDKNGGVCALFSHQIFQTGELADGLKCFLLLKGQRHEI